jgi:hypothetical protein
LASSTSTTSKNVAVFDASPTPNSSGEGGPVSGSHKGSDTAVSRSSNTSGGNGNNGKSSPDSDSIVEDSLQTPPPSSSGTTPAATTTVHASASATIPSSPVAIPAPASQLATQLQSVHFPQATTSPTHHIAPAALAAAHPLPAFQADSYQLAALLATQAPGHTIAPATTSNIIPPSSIPAASGGGSGRQQQFRYTAPVQQISGHRFVPQQVQHHPQVAANIIAAQQQHQQQQSATSGGHHHHRHQHGTPSSSGTAANA